MNITPAMGVIEVCRINKPVKLSQLDDILIFPNPTEGEVMIQFRVEQESETEVSVIDMVGRQVMEVVNTKMPSGEYKYVVNLTPLTNGFYLVSVKTDTQISTSKIIINK
jgi:hypothetical protein